MKDLGCELARYLDDGTLEISNIAAERAIRPLVLGRKNYLFAVSDAGGRAHPPRPTRSSRPPSSTRSIPKPICTRCSAESPITQSIASPNCCP